jgi:hypothetical protein
MQKGTPLAYFSKFLGPNTSAKSVYEKEAMAVLEAMEILGTQPNAKEAGQAL